MDHAAHPAPDDHIAFSNDLSARVRRYYWSEDFGYALWLRLYVESARVDGGTTRLP